MIFFKEVQIVSMGTWRCVNLVQEVFNFVHLVQQKNAAKKLHSKKSWKTTRNCRGMTSGKVALQKKGVWYFKKYYVFSPSLTWCLPKMEQRFEGEMKMCRSICTIYLERKRRGKRQEAGWEYDSKNAERWRTVCKNKSCGWAKKKYTAYMELATCHLTPKVPYRKGVLIGGVVFPPQKWLWFHKCPGKKSRPAAEFLM